MQHLTPPITTVHHHINISNNISNISKYNKSSYKLIKYPSCNGKHFTKANLHELLNELIVESNEYEDDSVATEDVIDNNDYTLLFNSTTSNKINPGDIIKLMSTPSNGYPPPSSTKNIDCES